MREENFWGYDIPFMLTGQMNMHPRSAISFLKGENNKDLVGFYDTIVEEE